MEKEEEEKEKEEKEKKEKKEEEKEKENEEGEKKEEEEEEEKEKKEKEDDEEDKEEEEEGAWLCPRPWPAPGLSSSRWRMDRAGGAVAGRGSALRGSPEAHPPPAARPEQPP